MHHIQPRRGFTLIELLVVIAIIAILAAILFPVFAQAREAARKATCQSNLKQFGNAFMMYQQDYDETYPGISGAGASNFQWFPHDLNGVSQGHNAQITWQQVLQPYIKNIHIYRCPSSRRFDPFGALAQPSITQRTGVTYVLNKLMAWQPQAAVAAPASSILLWEGYGDQALESVAHNGYPGVAGAFGPGNPFALSKNDCALFNALNGTPFLYDKAHAGKHNFLYNDGHVKALPMVGRAQYHPFARLNADGTLASYWLTVLAGYPTRNCPPVFVPEIDQAQITY